MDDANDTGDGVVSGAATSDAGPAGDWQTALTRSRAGRSLLAVSVGVIAFWIVAPNMPSSPIRDELAPFWKPATQAGLVQDWAVFSPNPRSQSIDVRARLEFDDGSIEFWDVPEFDPIIGAFRQYRWHKWQERLRLDSREKYWQSTAIWIADQNQRDGVRPLRITLIRRWIDHQPLTSSGTTVDEGWNEFEFFEWERDA